MQGVLPATAFASWITDEHLLCLLFVGLSRDRFCLYHAAFSFFRVLAGDVMTGIRVIRPAFYFIDIISRFEVRI
jgi:hypothetical protein